MKVQNFRHLIAQFDRLLLLKIYKKVKKVQRSYVSWHWRVIQNLNKNWFVVPKMTHIWWILTGALWSLKNLRFDWFLLCNVYVWPKTVMQNLKKDWLAVWKLTWETWKIFTRAPESVKVVILMGSLCPTRWAINLQRSYVQWHSRMMKNLIRSWLVVSKLTWEILHTLTWALESLKNVHFNGLLFIKT